MVDPKSEKGQAMVEFALVLPLLLLLISGIIDFGFLFGNQLLVNNASREAARYTAIHYYDSTTDDDGAIAEQIVADRVPTLDSPSVSLAKSTTASGESITIDVSGSVDMLTPIIAALFTDGKCTLDSQCTMRLE